jgi:hypothetical protein
MPLIDLKTDLTSLKFGGDRPGGGSSREPFVQGKPLNKRIADDGIETLGSTGGPDMFIRGGFKAATSTANDLERLGKYFSTVEGGLFVVQQNTLSALGNRIYGGYPLNVRAENSFRLNDGVYTPLSTLAAATGVSIGGHPNKQGTDPTGLSIYGRPEYLKLLKGDDNNFTTLDDSIKENSKNRLWHLYKTKIIDKNGSEDTELFSYLGGPNAGKNGSLKTIIKTASDRTFGQYENFIIGNPEFRRGEYLPIIGQPELKSSQLTSLYNTKLGTPQGLTFDTYDGGVGIGQVNLKVDAQTQTSGRENPLNDNGALKYSTFSQEQIQNAVPKGNGSTSKVTDFRKSLLYKPKSIISDSPDYTTKNIENRVNLGDPGARGVLQDRSNYTKGNPANKGGLDKINSLYLYRSENVTTDKRKNDLVKFRIAILDNDNPKIKTFAHFRAFIDSFSDSMSAQWSNFKYTGRGEDFYTYQGFNASYNVDFTVAAQSREELSIQYQKLNYIKSTLAPSYSDSGYMRGNIAQLTMGGYLYEMPGIIESFNITIPTDATWEIGIPATAGQDTNAAGSNGFTDSGVKELPHRVTVSMTFKPIYKFLPETVKDINGGSDITQRFISLEDADGKSSNNLYADGIKAIYKPGAGTINELDENPETNTVTDDQVNDFLDEVDNANATGDVFRP